ncbi:DUF3267 domain-containing protein [Natranaerobius thermophilus]|uniref:Zincin peptidase n=1 Tax=Natranaerobius thermophilus (strain ATCC BAA-1301 / DSM 18059 / JW/NM-WN-LF) TaxID=457570 RepID=B2A428_NATTJ|nr:DUF3267 domain-containing protein [Natranaerobius thermophilus]ACB85130.1 hypothetical protein Nther_1553 [Natranaerobius thermophilus JW/NM-WN-LF]
MFNIKLKGKYTDEAQLIKGKELPAGSNQFKESNTVMGIFIKGMIMMLPLILPMVIIGIIKIREISNEFEVNLSLVITYAVMLLLSYLLIYVHEFIHALLYPKSAVKEIWKYPSEGAYFVYCDEVISKTRFIIINLAPAFFLGIIPYVIWLLIYDVLPLNISICFAILTWITTLMGGGDFYNVCNTILQVPNRAKIFNYGFHSYWIK